MISLNTRLIGLIGDPLNHSLASKMHNTVIKELKLDFLYIPIEVKEKNLGKIIAAIRCMNFVGFNVTKPYKVKIIEYLDELDQLAKVTGAVNTVVKKGNRLIGYNTDGDGFVKGLIDLQSVDKNSRVFIFGAGGASRAISFSLVKYGVKKIYVTDKMNELSNKLVNDLNEFQNEKYAEFVSFTDNAIGKSVQKSNIIINATGLGMYSSIDEKPMDKKYLSSNMLVCDLTYNPLKTKFLLEAESIGCKTMNGVSMLVNQGVECFHLWTGRKDTVEIMKKTIDKINS